MSGYEASVSGLFMVRYGFARIVYNYSRCRFFPGCIILEGALLSFFLFHRGPASLRWPTERLWEGGDRKVLENLVPRTRCVQNTRRSRRYPKWRIRRRQRKLQQGKSRHFYNNVYLPEQQKADFQGNPSVTILIQLPLTYSSLSHLVLL